MCGIAGLYHFDGKPIDREMLQRMTDLIAHRGPDGEGHYVNEGVGLGHRRLAIIDLHTGDQPMFNDDGSIAIVFNGEIYNYLELRQELIAKGAAFRTDSDTEVIIQAYLHWGDDCQNKFNGMWAFALWDNRRRRLLLSRDRLGEKPLHYSDQGNTLIFGSEIKSVLAAGVPPDQCNEMLEIFLAFKCIPAPYTFYKNIRKLLPGHYIVADSSGIKEKKYWDLPELDESDMIKNKAEVYEQFEGIFKDSVKIRMRSDVPFGAFLSGGLDSASVVAEMSQFTNHPIRTFTIGFEDSEFDESRLAQLVADKFHTDHKLGTVEEEDFEMLLAKVVRHFDEPFGDPSAIPTGQVSKYAVDRVKMVLTGDGGDEVLSGYTEFQGIKASNYYQRIPSPIRSVLPGAVQHFSSLFTGRSRYEINRYANLLQHASEDFLTRLLGRLVKPDIQQVGALLNNRSEIWSARDYMADFLSKTTYNDDFYKQVYLNLKFDLPNRYLVKVDRMSMAHSLETRLPFLDHRLVEFMVRVDKNVKMQGFERKSVLRNTIGKRLPQELLRAPKKGFRVPVREWFKGKGVSERLGRISARADLYNVKEMGELIERNTKSEEDNGNLLWSMVVLGEFVRAENTPSND